MSRDLKVADMVRDELARVLQFEMRDPRVGSFVTINDVRVSRDLSYADIYVSSLQADSETAHRTGSSALARGRNPGFDFVSFLT